VFSLAIFQQIIRLVCILRSNTHRNPIAAQKYFEEHRDGNERVTHTPFCQTHGCNHPREKRSDLDSEFSSGKYYKSFTEKARKESERLLNWQPYECVECAVWQLNHGPISHSGVQAGCVWIECCCLKYKRPPRTISREQWATKKLE